jgi:hypothetical protein
LTTVFFTDRDLGKRFPDTLGADLRYHFFFYVKRTLGLTKLQRQDASLRLSEESLRTRDIGRVLLFRPFHRYDTKQK